MRLGALLALGATPGAGQHLHSCTKDCVCDGVDLSQLKDKVFEMPEIVAPDPGHPGPVTDPWSYRISVCTPLPHDQIPAFCENDRHSPRMIRFKTADSSHNATHPTHGDCQRVGMDVIYAAAHTATDPSSSDPSATVQAVQLLFTAEDGGNTHVVTADLTCEVEAGTLAPPSAVSRTQPDGSNDVDYTFEWPTEAACPPPPPPPCIGCTCAGVDLSLLSGTIEAPGFSKQHTYPNGPGKHCNDPGPEQDKTDGWAYKVSVCGTINKAELPACTNFAGSAAHVAQFPGPGHAPACPEGGSPSWPSGPHDCCPVGQGITSAVRTSDPRGVKLTWASPQGCDDGNPTEVEGTFTCDETVGVGQIEKMEMEVASGSVRDAKTKFMFWESVCKQCILSRVHCVSCLVCGRDSTPLLGGPQMRRGGDLPFGSC